MRNTRTPIQRCAYVEVRERERKRGRERERKREREREAENEGEKEDEEKKDYMKVLIYLSHTIHVQTQIGHRHYSKRKVCTLNDQNKVQG